MQRVIRTVLFLSLLSLVAADVTGVASLCIGGECTEQCTQVPFVSGVCLSYQNVKILIDCVNPSLVRYGAVQDVNCGALYGYQWEFPPSTCYIGEVNITCFNFTDPVSPDSSSGGWSPDLSSTGEEPGWQSSSSTNDGSPMESSTGGTVSTSESTGSTEPTGSSASESSSAGTNSSSTANSGDGDDGGRSTGLSNSASITVSLGVAVLVFMSSQ